MHFTDFFCRGTTLTFCSSVHNRQMLTVHISFKDLIVVWCLLQYVKSAVVLIMASGDLLHALNKDVSVCFKHQNFKKQCSSQFL